jgi:putative hydrolase of the HAD superfamily
MKRSRSHDVVASVGLEDWRNRFLVLDQRGFVHKAIVYATILAEFGGVANAANTLLTDYQSRCSRFAHPRAGMVEVLSEIRERGFSIGIVTNGETDFQTRHIEALGLDRLVDATFISQREGLRKPDAKLFLRAAAALETVPERCLFVGDNPVADILGAAATGMKTAWFRGTTDWPPDKPANPGPTIDHLGAVLSLIEPQCRMLKKIDPVHKRLVARPPTRTS